MTIGIAAVSQVNNDPKIVACCDWRLSSSLGSAETGHKLGWIVPGWRFIFAGSPDSSRSALVLLEKHFGDHKGPIDETNILPLISGALAARKRQLIEEFIQGQLGIPYQWFLDFGKQKLLENDYRVLIEHIRGIKLGVVFAIFGFVERFPYLIETGEDCSAKIKEHFVTIGDGCYLADAVLIDRAQQAITQEGRTAYNVFEAFQHAKRVVSVGPNLTFIKANVDGTIQALAPEGFEFLKTLYAEYGPKPAPEIIDVDAAFGSSRN